MSDEFCYIIILSLCWANPHIANLNYYQFIVIVWPWKLDIFIELWCCIWFSVLTNVTSTGWDWILIIIVFFFFLILFQVAGVHVPVWDGIPTRDWLQFPDQHCWMNVRLIEWWDWDKLSPYMYTTLLFVYYNPYCYITSMPKKGMKFGLESLDQRHTCTWIRLGMFIWRSFFELKKIKYSQ